MRSSAAATSSAIRSRWRARACGVPGLPGAVEPPAQPVLVGEGQRRQPGPQIVVRGAHGVLGVPSGAADGRSRVPSRCRVPGAAQPCARITVGVHVQLIACTVQRVVPCIVPVPPFAVPRLSFDHPGAAVTDLASDRAAGRATTLSVRADVQRFMRLHARAQDAGQRAGPDGARPGGARAALPAGPARPAPPGRARRAGARRPLDRQPARRRCSSTAGWSAGWPTSPTAGPAGWSSPTPGEAALEQMRGSARPARAR